MIQRSERNVSVNYSNGLAAGILTAISLTMFAVGLYGRFNFPLDINLLYPIVLIPFMSFVVTTVMAHLFTYFLRDYQPRKQQILSDKFDKTMFGAVVSGLAILAVVVALTQKHHLISISSLLFVASGIVLAGIVLGAVTAIAHRPSPRDVIQEESAEEEFSVEPIFDCLQSASYNLGLSSGPSIQSNEIVPPLRAAVEDEGSSPALSSSMHRFHPLPSSPRPSRRQSVDQSSVEMAQMNQVNGRGEGIRDVLLESGSKLVSAARV